MSDNWADPGHDLPPSGTYQPLDAWITDKGKAYVGVRAIRVVALNDVIEALRSRGEYACCGFEQEAADFIADEFGADW